MKDAFFHSSPFFLVLNSLLLLLDLCVLVVLNLVHHVLVMATSGFKHLSCLLFGKHLVFQCFVFLVLESSESVLHYLCSRFDFLHTVVVVEHQKTIVVNSPHIINYWQIKLT